MTRHKDSVLYPTDDHCEKLISCGCKIKHPNLLQLLDMLPKKRYKYNTEAVLRIEDSGNDNVPMLCYSGPRFGYGANEEHIVDQAAVLICGLVNDNEAYFDSTGKLVLTDLLSKD